MFSTVCIFIQEIALTEDGIQRHQANGRWTCVRGMQIFSSAQLKPGAYA